MDIFHGQDFVRKQFPVQAVRVTVLNIAQLTEVCGGELKHDGEKEGNFSRDYIQVPVRNAIHENQTKAHVGDWLVKQGRTFKVYKDKGFRAMFESKDGKPVPGSHAQPRPKAKGPNPGNMPKKRTPDELREINAQRSQERSESDILKSEQEEFARRQEQPDPSEGIDLTRREPEVNKEIVNPEAAQAARADIREGEAALIDRKIEEGKLPLAAPAEQRLPERGDSFSYDDSFAGPAEAIAKVEELKAEQGPEVVTFQSDKTQEEVVREKLEEKAEAQPVKPKPITLDELNAMPSDDRTPEEIHQESIKKSPPTVSE